MEYMYTAALALMVGYGLGAWSWKHVWAWLLGDLSKAEAAVKKAL